MVTQHLLLHKIKVERLNLRNKEIIMRAKRKKNGNSDPYNKPNTYVMTKFVKHNYIEKDNAENTNP